MSGQHAVRRHPNVLPITVAAVATAVLVTAAVGAFRLDPEPTGAALPGPVAVDRYDDRADRSEPRESSGPTAVPSASPSASAVPSPTRSASRRPTTAASAGSCGASYYETGTRTANGERFDPNGLTAAHRTFPFNTRVRVTNTANGRSVEVRINDRGPFVGARCLDLARGAFVSIASISTGVINVRYEVVK